MSAISIQSTQRRRRYLQISAASVLLLGLAACKEEIVAEQVVRPVKVQAVAEAKSERILTYSGSVQPRTVSPLGFRVSGKILERRVDVGDRVIKGDVIATLDATDLVLQAQSAEANLAAAKTRTAVAADALKRAKTLFDEGHVAQAALDSAQLEADSAARAEDAIVASLNQARNQIAYATLTADKDGIVTAIGAQAGQVIAAGTPVINLAHDGEKEVRIDVPEQDIASLGVGEAVEVSLYAKPDAVIAGKIREIAAAADPSSRTFAVRVAIGDPEDVRLGMTADVTAKAPLQQAGVLVPLSAISQHDGTKSVWIADRESGTVRPQAVVVSSFATEGVRVQTGLRAGDLVVVAGVQFLTPDLKVKIEPQTVAQGTVDTLAN